MNPPPGSGPTPPENPALARRALRWLIAGVCLAVVTAATVAWLGNTRIPKETAVLIVFGFCAAGFSSAVGAWLFYFGLSSETRGALPNWTRSLARVGAVVATGSVLLVVLAIAFAASSIK